MKSLPYIFLIVLLPLSWVGSQTSVSLKGKVVELLVDKTKPMPGVVVSVSGESYDVTGADGSFKLFAPEGLEFVTITVKGTENKVLSPFENKINLPPMYQPILIRLSNENNKKLLTKVNALNTRIKTLQKDKNLSARQVEMLHKTMLDTIEHYQAIIDAYVVKLDAAEKENTTLKARIVELENQNKVLEEKLFLALGEKYSEQQKLYTSITGLLNTYTSRLKDVHKAIPADALACAENAPQACNRFYSTIEKYNQSRNAINEQKDQHLQAVEHQWSDPAVALQLDKTYSYLLNEIHQPLLFDKMNMGIIDPLKSRSRGKTKLKSVTKQISTEGSALAAELSPRIAKLDELKLNLYNLLSHSIQ